MTLTVMDWLGKLSLKPGDILLIDPERVDMNAVITCGRELNLKNPVLCVFPKSGDSMIEALRTCDLETLEKVVAEMKGIQK